MRTPPSLPVLGWREWAALPELGLMRVAGKLDTGARTSALHVERLDCCVEDGLELARFTLLDEDGKEIEAVAPVSDRRRVTSSNGESSRRVFVRTHLVLGGRRFSIELSLAHRHGLRHPLLIGRSALAGRFLVDSQRSWLAGEPT
ncbi:MAG: RimK/LysX family protein [Lysobacteraceae bacterium]